METATIERAGATTFGEKLENYDCGWTLRVGSLIRIDGRSVAVDLRPDPLGWAPWRIDSGLLAYGRGGLAVSVTVTGRKRVKVSGHWGGAVRVNVEFLGDGEPSRHVGGYWLLD